MFYTARRKLTEEFPDGKVDMKKLSDEYDELEQAHNTTYGEFKTVRDDLHRLWKVKSCVDTLAYPIFRAENRENFERMLSQDERNHAVRVDAQTEEKPVTEDFLGKTEPRDYTPEYQLLDRLRMDCEYFLGAGQHKKKPGGGDPPPTEKKDKRVG